MKTSTIKSISFITASVLLTSLLLPLAFAADAPPCSPKQAKPGNCSTVAVKVPPPPFIPPPEVVVSTPK